MLKAERKIIADIILANAHIGRLQAEIEKEQEVLLADLISPAKKIVEALIALDNRRIDLCNLNVLYGFIARELGDRFIGFKSEIERGSLDSPCFSEAATAITRCGYDTSRAAREFCYIFKPLAARRKRSRAIIDALQKTCGTPLPRELSAPAARAQG